MSVVADKEKEKEKTNAVCSLSSNNNNKNVSGNNIKSINRESVEFQEECDRLENCVECQQLLKECLACRDDPTIKELLRQYKQLNGEQDHLRHRASSPSPIQQRNRGMPTKQHYEQKQQQIQPYQQRRYSPLGRQNSNNYGNQRDYQQYHRRSPDGGSSKQIGNYKRQSRSSSQEDRLKYRSNNNSTINRPPSQVPPPPAERKIIPSSTSNQVQQLNKQSKNGKDHTKEQEPFQRNISRSPDSEHRNRNYQQSKHPSGSMNTGGSYSRNNRNDYQGRYGMQYQPKKYNNSQSRPRRPPSSDRSNSSRSRSRERQATAKKSPRESLRRTNADFDRNKRSPHREISRRSESSSRSNSDSRQRYPSKSKSKSKSRSRSYAKDRSERTSSHRRSSSSSRSSKSSSRRSSSSSHNSTNNNNNNPHHPNLDELQLQIDMQFSKKQQQL